MNGPLTPKPAPLENICDALTYTIDLVDVQGCQ